VVGPEILDHRCLRSNRNSVIVVPEILESVFAIMNSCQNSVDGPEILDHRVVRSYRNSVIVVPEILEESQSIDYE
jgi:hypothetical protein